LVISNFFKEFVMSRSTAIQATNAVPHTAITRDENRESWSYVPQVDVLEASQEFLLICDAPGLSTDNINLTFENGVLHIDGRVPQRYPEDIQFLRQEYGVGDFYREITLGRLAEFVDGERLAAEYAEGVLTIHLPKVEAAKPKKITVNTK
jgi:HSP20 family protein